MPKIIETTVYEFHELSDEAKEKAREWYRQGLSELLDLDHVIDDAAACGELLGITFDTCPVKLYGGGTRHEPCIYWSGFYSQGSGVSFAGSYAYRKGAHRLIRQYAPQDAELHRIADGLLELQRRYGYRVACSVSSVGHGSHEGCAEFEETGDSTTSAEDCGTLRGLLRDFMRWIYSQLQREYEYQFSDEAVEASIAANEYEFTETGARA